jgi:Glycosyl transferase family 2
VSRLFPMRARHIRWRLLQLLEDTRHTRLAFDAARQQLSSLQRALAQSEERAAALVAALIQVQASLEAGQLRQDEAQRMLGETQHELRRYGGVLELLYEEETSNLGKLGELRRLPSYTDAFTDPEPLVSVIIPTYLNHELLVTRAIPSALGQTYRHIEIVVVGDAAPEATAQAIERLDDARVRYENLTVRAPYPEDQAEFWRVAGTAPWNAAWALARGVWIAPLNDDDSFRPEHVELLLAAARRRRSEVSYGAIAQQHPDGETKILNSWPPELGKFGWQAALVHAGLGFMPMQLGSGALGVPGDWSLCRRMRRAGVRFGNIDDVVVDYYPSLLWSQASASSAP